ncbi:MAG: hypothetical protein NZ989_00240 [Bacteroidia bacterium]|nr:hypothetical protein [Bacteroidia bacterium]MDW8056805.1 dihydrodipicolinate reductase C-terminal domain-containing protein [Bacteroidia bacterium]
MRIGIIGTGRMGQALAAVAAEKNYSIAYQIGRFSPELVESAEVDVVIDFSHASQVPNIVEVCLSRDIPLVTGTTGWYAALPHLQSFAQRKPSARWLWGGNFSRGILLMKVALQALLSLWDKFGDWEALLLEAHHRHKKDAPSGTALELQKVFSAVKAIHSLRVGEIVGEHKLILSGSGEEVEILHRAHDRRIFAQGALWAAEWLLSQPYFVGSFEMALGVRVSS